jgi:hypothetical protein
VLGLAAAGGDAVRVRRSLDQALDFIEGLHLAEVMSSDVELADLPHSEGAWSGSGGEDGDEAGP